jgi:steroid 5-alpha reductase family enzyme
MIRTPGGGTMSLSLRSFHLFFITASVVLSAAVAAWGVQSWRASGSGSDLAFGGLFVMVGVVLAFYGVRVRRKLRDLGPED